MTQKIPRNTLLHERNHKRKAGPHSPPKRPVEPAKQEVHRFLREPQTLTNGLSDEALDEWYEKKGKLK